MAEQVAGIIVGCMPVMPAFFQRIFFRAECQNPNTHVSSGQKDTKLRYATYGINSGLGSREGRIRKAALQGPYCVTPTLTTDIYEELDDLEGGKDYRAKTKANLAAGGGNPFESSSSAGTASLKVPDNVALVSRRPAEWGPLPEKF